MADFEDRLAAAKDGSLAQHTMRAARLFHELGLARVRGQLGVPIRRAHVDLFPHIDLDGTRLTDLARRIGVSKQAVAPLVKDLLGWGMLEQVADPADGRARRLRFPRDGGLTLLEGMASLGELDATVADALGAERTAELTRAMAEVAQLLAGLVEE